MIRFGNLLATLLPTGNQYTRTGYHRTLTVTTPLSARKVVVFWHELVKKVLYRLRMSPVCELSDYRLNAKDRIGDIVF
jgi:hypothetical protein